MLVAAAVAVVPDVVVAVVDGEDFDEVTEEVGELLVSGRSVVVVSKADTKSYILVCSVGILFIVGYNVVCGILRGLGDSKTPLYFVALACVINIVLDFILVGYFHLGATGAAVATITAQGVSFMISLWFLYRHGFHFEFTRKDIRLNRNLAKKVMTLGAPIALQDALINISFLIITVIVNQMGVIASASLGVVEKIIVFAMLPPMAISSAVATMTAQN
jgi:Na+-driven multidrug efflux pump